VPSVTTPAAIELDDVSMRFGALEAIRAVHLRIEPGQFVSLLGPSGCGKSTLLRLVNGLLQPTSGAISVDGSSPESARRAKRFALVPQTPALLPWRTVRHNIDLIGQVNRHGGGAPEPAVIDDLLEAVGLAGFAEALPHTLSGGMQQRVALVRAFASEAPVLLMDEPFAALDEIIRAEMRGLLLALWERRAPTVLFVTHSIAEAVALSDRVVVLAARPGRIVADVTIGLPRPRTANQEDSPEFAALAAELRVALRSGMTP
jgi:NitT/TauT family transport system ATP-binding protein